MAPLVPKGSWALIEVGAPTSGTLKDQAIYLFRPGPREAPSLRRVARVPSLGDGELTFLMVGVDAPGQIPLRFSESQIFDGHRLLGLVAWVGRSLR